MVNGYLNLFKLPGPTSHDMISQIRKSYKFKKVGHLGTLDPAACGVLPICIGKATKFSQYVINQDKIYRFELTLGKTTDTLDALGEVTEEVKVEKQHEEALKQNYTRLIGETEQIPPMFSAVKMKGKKLYELAREGKEVRRKTRKIRIYSLSLIKEYEQKGQKRFLFQVACSKGTYIRTLAYDLAELSGCKAGHVSFLLREKSGPFKLDNALIFQNLPHKEQKLKELMFPIDFPLSHYPSLVLNNEKSAQRFTNGNFLSASIVKKLSTFQEKDLIRVYHKGIFLGLGQIIEGKSLKPEKISG